MCAIRRIKHYPVDGFSSQMVLACMQALLGVEVGTREKEKKQYFLSSTLTLKRIYSQAKMVLLTLIHYIVIYQMDSVIHHLYMCLVHVCASWEVGGRGGGGGGGRGRGVAGLKQETG